jgi:hypothetical protein
MNRVLAAACVLTAIVTIQGCATKTYGRQGTVTNFEKDTLSCREIDIEAAKVQGFLEQVNTESQFSGRDVLAILGDFGIGNNMERTAAIESADRRSAQLRDLRTAKGCKDPGVGTEAAFKSSSAAPGSAR